jgi:hypothetical protein
VEVHRSEALASAKMETPLQPDGRRTARRVRFRPERKAGPLGEQQLAPADRRRGVVGRRTSAARTARPRLAVAEWDLAWLPVEPEASPPLRPSVPGSRRRRRRMAWAPSRDLLAAERWSTGAVLVVVAAEQPSQGPASAAEESSPVAAPPTRLRGGPWVAVLVRIAQTELASGSPAVPEARPEPRRSAVRTHCSCPSAARS